jgi:probable HAF family extracellular repeat protein
MNNLGHVVGYHWDCDFTFDEAFAWTPQSGLVTLEMPAEVFDSEAVDVNDSEEIVGTMQTSDAGVRAFLYSDGWLIDLGVLPGALWSGASGRTLAPSASRPMR